jgi:hypothetical protein
LDVVRSVGVRLTSLRLLDRRLLALLGVFLGTRLVMAFLAGNPPLWTPSGPTVVLDVYTYREWSFRIVASGGMPYSEVPIEYPPGILPFVLVPAWLLHQLKVPFLLSFILLMTVVDGLGLLGLQRLGRRWGSDLGAWLWVVALPLLGPIVLLRLDLVPAVATIWCLERAAAGRWTAGGMFLGFGCLAKVYPVFLLPAAIVIAPQRRRFIQGALAVGLLGIAPLVGSIRAMTTHVAGYHADRGIQIESLWGNLLLVADRLGFDATVRQGFGSFDITAGIAGTVKTLSTVLSLVAIALVVWVARRSRLRGDPRYLAATFFATLALLLVTGRVLSPQYLIWLLALAAAAAAHFLERRTMALLLTSVLLTQVEYPFRFFDLLSGKPVTLAVLTLRNACLIILAFYAVRAWLAMSGTRSAGGSHKRQLTVAMSRSLAGQRPDNR